MKPISHLLDPEQVELDPASPGSGYAIMRDWIPLSEQLTDTAFVVYALALATSCERGGGPIDLTNDQFAFLLYIATGSMPCPSTVEKAIGRLRAAGLLVEVGTTGQGQRMREVIARAEPGYMGWRSAHRKAAAYVEGWHTLSREERPNPADHAVEFTDADWTAGHKGWSWTRIQSSVLLHPTAAAAKRHYAVLRSLCIETDDGATEWRMELPNAAQAWVLPGRNGRDSTTRRIEDALRGLRDAGLVTVHRVRGQRVLAVQDTAPDRDGFRSVHEALCVHSRDWRTRFADRLPTPADLHPSEGSDISGVAVDNSTPSDPAPVNFGGRTRKFRGDPSYISGGAQGSDQGFPAPEVVRTTKNYPSPPYVGESPRAGTRETQGGRGNPIEMNLGAGERPALRLADAAPQPVHQPSPDHTRLEVWDEVDPRFLPRSVRERLAS